MYTIKRIADFGLCTGCGTCAGVCPSEAIEMERCRGLLLPKLHEEKCNKCGLCVKSCPGHRVSFEELNNGIFKKQPRDTSLGNYLRCYIGHSNNEVRNHASSGGIAPRLLIFALEQGIIDGALVVRMKKDRPLETEPFVARTKEEIISATRSKYCPVSMNEVLHQIIRESGRFAVVGLPCHIHGIRKAERVSKILQERIALRIGLFCSRTADFLGTEFLLEKVGVRKEQVIELNYRGKGWPGSMSIRLRDGSNSSIPCRGWNSYWPVFSSFFFTPMRCIMCPDHTNELADISLGDAWLPELKRWGLGESIILTRTDAAENLLALANSAGAISIRPVEPEKIKQSQAEPLKFKKNDLGARLSTLKSVGKEIPIFSPTPNSSISFAAFLRTLFAYFNINASSKRLRSLLIHVPFPLFRLYYGLRKFLSLI